jgi:nucleotide-binding universal stress UspA family protein
MNRTAVDVAPRGWRAYVPGFAPASPPTAAGDPELMSTRVEHQPVLVGVDGSPAMFLAVACAVDDAGSLSAPLRIVVVYHPEVLEDEVLAAGAPPDSSHPRPLRLAHQHADAAAAHAKSLDPNLHEGTACIAGARTTVLLEEAHRSALIVVGSPRLGRLHRASTRSTGAATSARAVCPVVVVRKRASRSLSETRVVVGVGGPASQKAAEFAFQEARRTNAGPTAVNAWHLNTADLASLVSPVDERQKLQARAQAMLAEALAPLSAAYPEVDVRRYVVGAPAELLEELSAKARLLVVGSRGLSPLSALLLGSVSRETITHAHCSSRRPPAHLVLVRSTSQVLFSTTTPYEHARGRGSAPVGGQGVLVPRVRSDVRDAVDLADCCGWIGCRGRGSYRRPPAAPRSWSGTGPSWSRSARAATVR